MIFNLKREELRYNNTVKVVKYIFLQLLGKDQVTHLENRFITVLNTRSATDTANIQSREFLINDIETLIFLRTPVGSPGKSS